MVNEPLSPPAQVACSRSAGIAANDLETLNKALIRLERFWTDQIRYQL